GQDRVVRVYVRGSIDPDLAVEGLPRRAGLVELGQEPIRIPNVDDGDAAAEKVVWRRSAIESRREGRRDDGAVRQVRSQRQASECIHSARRIAEAERKGPRNA